ncbi:16S rRNA (cytosine(1402)-N(4))-methyltransferase RsmH [Pseudochelatococcus contaminans]|uniref:Ribosomal RNA small subunit methyltransferase H n=1 Tax=Pseudochelatococcus contaminans TaxID=1538103 RepID=A0A7W6EEJ0_9HYPH|nr:16S rRNA (cytosine(1402)-N(4))-methyltransferase RsmH [Pseudochelatococcus contaminans]MBB3808249.1 16S rRNA (cytosine1402-N4)-methyltransferase [Pseudochelatococcus contaminans]
MTGRDDGPAGVAGGPARHVPVLLDEVIASLQPHADGVYLDGTFGAGGYTAAILAHAGTRVIGLDRDPSAIAGGAPLVAASQGRLTLVETVFGEMEDAIRAQGLDAVDGVVLDIGVSSMQIDEADRGFSLRFDGPLDMRMEQAGESAADVVNTADESLLADIIYNFGEERRSRFVARAIVERRAQAPITTTAELADIVAGVVWAEPHGPHPATRTFQALRIYVNDELGELSRALHAAERILRPGGRLVVVTFHSLEDRIVKQFLARRSARSGGGSRHMPEELMEAPTFRLVSRGVVAPTEAECARNSRARSAKLRAAERTDAPVREVDESVMSLAALPERRTRRRGR